MIILQTKKEVGTAPPIDDKLCVAFYTWAKETELHPSGAAIALPSG